MIDLYFGIGKNFKSVITMSNYYCDIYEMIVPKVIGVIKKGFLRHFRSDRVLVIKNRLRASEIEE